MKFSPLSAKQISIGFFPSYWSRLDRGQEEIGVSHRAIEYHDSSLLFAAIKIKLPSRLSCHAVCCWNFSFVSVRNTSLTDSYTKDSRIIVLFPNRKNLLKNIAEALKSSSIWTFSSLHANFFSFHGSLENRIHAKSISGQAARPQIMNPFERHMLQGWFVLVQLRRNCPSLTLRYDP